MIPRVKRFVALSVLGAAVAAEEGFAAERIDLFDARGRRSGYVVVDREAGRIDLYDARSRRTGWGKVDQGGRIELFDLGGRRQGTLTPSENPPTSRQ